MNTYPPVFRRKKGHITGKKSHSEKPTHHPFIAFDIEDYQDSTNQKQFRCANVYGEYKDQKGKTYKVSKQFTSLDDFKAFLLSFKVSKHNIPFRLIAYNTAYDAFWIKDIINDQTRLERGDGNFISARLINNIPVWDITNHWAGKIPLLAWYSYLYTDSDLKRVFQRDKSEWEKWKTLKEKEKELIETITEDEWLHICKLDTKLTWLLTNFVENFYTKVLKIPMSLTVGKSALNYWCYHHTDQTWIRDYSDLDAFERLAYRGGRSETFQYGELDTSQYDVNSMYVAIMSDYFFPNPCVYNWIKSDENFESYFNSEKDYLMLIKCKVNVPKMKIAPLPYKERGGKLIFPIGTFEGVFTSAELKEALKYGVKIEKVKEYVVYFEKGKYFKSFANDVYAKRMEYKKNGNEGMQLLIKTIGNSLYGKFAQRNGSSHKWEKYNGEPFEKIKNYDIQTDEKGNITNVYKGNAKRIDSIHSFPVLSVFITSYARIKLLKYLKEYEKDIVYCDTDSLHILKGKAKITPSEKLGELKLEEEGKKNYIKAKWYGEKLKGVPKNAITNYENEKAKVVEFERVLKRNESIRKKKEENEGLFVPNMKIISKRDDKRKGDFPIKLNNGKYKKPEKETIEDLFNDKELNDIMWNASTCTKRLKAFYEKKNKNEKLLTI